MPFAISHRYLDTDFPRPYSLETKITIFADQIFGWQLDVAETLKGTPSAGFAILSVLMSYFEMISKYESGDLRRSPVRHFKQGIRSVFGPHATDPIPDDVLTVLYRDVRCGMYHEALTTGKVMIGVNPSGPAFAWDGQILALDPHQLADVIRRHFASYIGRLMMVNGSQDLLRARFEKVFDARR